MNRASALALSFAACCLLSAPTLRAAEKARGTNTGMLPGSSSKDPVNIDAAKLDYFDKEQKLIYTGNVVATQGDSRLRATSLVIFLNPKDPDSSSTPSSSNNQVRRMEAAGPVTLTSKDQVGTGDSGLYEKAENKVYLFGNVTLSQGPNVTKGDKLVYDLNTSQAVVLGRVRSMFLPSSSNNEDDKNPARAPAAAKRDSTAKVQ